MLGVVTLILGVVGMHQLSLGHSGAGGSFEHHDAVLAVTVGDPEVGYQPVAADTVGVSAQPDGWCGVACGYPGAVVACLLVLLLVAVWPLRSPRWSSLLRRYRATVAAPRLLVLRRRPPLTLIELSISRT